MHRIQRSEGQSLVIFAVALVALLAMVGLIIDGGNAFAQQRRTQNGMDAAVEAGAVQLARRMVGLAPTPAGPANDAVWDARVLDAVTTTATANGVTLHATDIPQYTDYQGNTLGPVGTGVIPANTQGVHAAGERAFGTFLVGVVGMGSWTATANATAVTGYVEEVSGAGLIPLTFPIVLTQCETGGGSNRLFHPFGSLPGGEWPYGPENLVALPLCNNGPGNVGWIDWTPTGGGASELAAQILNHTGPPVHVPEWHYVPQTGAVTSVDDEMDFWEGKDILLPIFYVEADDPATPQDESILGTCDTEPTDDRFDLGDCPAGHNGGNGSNQWYYLVDFGEFHLEHAYISENRETECNDTSTLASIASAATGPGTMIKNCLIGWFKGPVFVEDGTVSGGPPRSSSTPLSVQLIR